MASFIPLELQLKKKGYNFIVGIDEAGRGPMAGPVVSAAVILKDKQQLPGLKDSKLLSEKKREVLFDKIIKNSLDYSISIVSHIVIDQINILNAVRFANKCCIEHLNIKPDIALMDGRDKQILEIPFLNIIKGDRYIKSIAAASILAKVCRDRIMKYYSKKYPEYHFDKNKGYGTRKHRSNYLKYGRCEIHRRSFEFKK